MRFSDIQHQDRALSIIRRALASGRTHHAYLFEGPQGVGKELTARALAARLLCEARDLAADADACGVCAACRTYASGNHPDFHLIHRGLNKRHPDRAIRASKGLFLAVDVVRHFLIEPAANSPAMGRRRVFLVRDAERMNEGAQNALLKTLEEPPGRACLILVTSSAERLLPTIRSRCQRVPFDLLPPGFVQEQLQMLASVEPGKARVLGALSQGRLGAALQWHRMGLLDAFKEVVRGLAARLPNDPEAFGKALIETAQGLAERGLEVAVDDEPLSDENDNGDTNSGKGGAKTLETDQLRDALKLVLMLVAAVYRDALISASADDVALRTLPSGIAVVEELARMVTGDQLAQRIEAIATAERMIDRNVAPQLACERLAAALTGELTSA